MQTFPSSVRMRVVGGGVGELLQPREGILGRKFQHSRVSIQHLPIEGSDLIEEALGGREPRVDTRAVLQRLAQCFGGLAHRMPVHSGRPKEQVFNDTQFSTPGSCCQAECWLKPRDNPSQATGLEPVWSDGLSLGHTSVPIVERRWNAFGFGPASMCRRIVAAHSCELNTEVSTSRS